MRILVVNGDCINKNSSANLCHMAYIRGMADNGYEVTVLSADGRDYKTDEQMKLPEGVENITIYGVSLYEKLSLKKTGGAGVTMIQKPSPSKSPEKKKRVSVKAAAKKALLSLYGVHGIYSTFVRKAMKFRDDRHYDYIISVSTPVTSHLIAGNLLRKKRVHADHWIQIWEDPWYSDAYGFNSRDKIYREEKRLLDMAEYVCYVSPLTLKKQQSIYPESASKMYWQPLPYYYKDEKEYPAQSEGNVYGYFGDYWPVARDLSPFYEAAKQEGITVNICGNPSNLFQPEENIHIYPRLNLNDLKKIEDQTNVLIFLCNRKGGQIPGKIYQYSASNKQILFILDGTEEEQAVLKEYFGAFERYVFCGNTKEEIIAAIRSIESGEPADVRIRCVEDFSPKEVMSRIIAGSAAL